MALSLSPLLFFSFSPRPDAPAWTLDSDPAHAAQLKSEAERRAQALQAREPSLRRVPLTRADLDALADDEDDAAPVGNVLARAERHIVLRGSWAGGGLTLRLHDALLAVELEVVDADAGAMPADLPGLLEGMARDCGWPLVGRPGEASPTPRQAAEEAWQRHARLTERLRSDERRRRRLQAAGPTGALLLSAGAWTLALLLLRDGIETGSLAAGADPARQGDFTVQRLAGAREGLNFPLRYRLAGTVDEGSRSVTLEVPRDVYLRAAPGARYTVVPTGDLRRPFLLERDAQPPLLRGERWGVSGVALAALLPLGLWGFGVVRPIASGRTPAMWMQMTRRTIGASIVAAAVIAAWWLRTR